MFRVQIMKRFLLLVLVLACYACCKGDEDAVVRGETAKIYCFNIKYKNLENFFVKVFFKDNQAAWIKYRDGVFSLEEDESMASHQRHRYSVLQSGHITLKDVVTGDEGKYECVTEAFKLPKTEQERIITTSLLVYVPPTIEVTPIQEILSEKTKEEVEAVECSALQGKPVAEVKWSTPRHLKFNQRISKEELSGDYFTVKSRLTIQPTKFYHDQLFTCTVSHPALATTKSISYKLNVTYAPDEPVIQVSSDHSKLTCHADSNPPAIITWLLPDGTVARSATVKLDGSTANPQDQYTCKAVNRMGENQSKISAHDALTAQPVVSTSSTSVIVGSICGVVVLLALIMLLVYFFLLKPSRTKDPGPYLPTTARDSSRPMIEHGSCRPSSPKSQPPVDSSDDGDDDGDGGNDVDINPYTSVPAPDKQQLNDSIDGNNPGGGKLQHGITSRASLNFQARRQRPGQNSSKRNSYVTNQQPQRPFSYMNNDELPPYEGNYSEIDHHNQPSAGEIHRNVESVEYAQIRNPQVV